MHARPHTEFCNAFNAWIDSGVSDGAFRTLIVAYGLLDQSTKRFAVEPTAENIAKIRGISPCSAKRHYAELEKSGLIKRDYRPIIGGGSSMNLTFCEPEMEGGIDE